MTIIFSTGNYEKSEQYKLYKAHHKEDKERRRVIENFKKRITPEEKSKGNNLKIIIVCNMLLTGFDAPIEQTMYKSMKSIWKNLKGLNLTLKYMPEKQKSLFRKVLSLSGSKDICLK
ncbi:MAG: hypothetical protein HN417_12290 [Desulfobacula sp.]|nr:hypothetical protein [Desulfobacula sp.]